MAIKEIGVIMDIWTRIERFYNNHPLLYIASFFITMILLVVSVIIGTLWVIVLIEDLLIKINIINIIESAITFPNGLIIIGITLIIIYVGVKSHLIKS